LPASRASRVVPWALAVLALLLAVLLYTRFSLGDMLSRDEAICAYGAQQWAHGVPFYTSIFDAKGPLSSALGGVAAWAASLVDFNDLNAIRLLFLAFACATAVGVYLLAARAWDSQLAGIAAAVTFISFRGFAVDAIGGPDPKTPGICFAVGSMTLLLRRRWFSGGVLAGLALLVWQPLGGYAVVAVLAAVIGSGAEARVRSALRAIAGVLAPVLVTFAYYLAAGSLSHLVDGMIVFPFTGVERKPETFSHRLHVITTTVDRYYGDTRVLLWGGLVLLPALIAWQVVRRRVSLKDPLVVAIAGSGLVVALFTASDFQGYPDVFPLLPYAALGIGGALGLGVRAMPGGRARQLAGGVGIAATAALALLTWHDYSTAASGHRLLRSKQQAAADRLSRLAGPRGTIWTLGNPAVLVFTHRRNPSRFIYLNSGFDAYVAQHTPGGLRGFADQILSSRPAVIEVDQWASQRRHIVLAQLQGAYRSRFVGRNLLLLPPAVLARAQAQGIPLARRPPPR
jgi:4-amino-4-deoxy-L-arabinose transferase-like glycosyltransferase